MVEVQAVTYLNSLSVLSSHQFSLKEISGVREELGGLTFHQAAREGRLDAVKRYLQSSYYNKKHRSAIAPIDRLDHDEVSALHYAARYNNTDIMEILCEHNADVNNKGQDDLTPLHYAARYAPRGTSADMEDMSYVPLPPTQEEEDEEEEEGEEGKKDKLMSEIIAEEYGSEPIKFLIQHGANVNAVDKYGLTAMHCAADRGNYAAVVELLNCTGVIIELKDKQGETPLHLAVRASDKACVRRLLKHGAAPNTANDSNLTALHSACTEGNLDIVEMLCKDLDKKGFTNYINQGNIEWMTPLHFATEVGEFEVCNYLVDKGATVTIKRKSLDTALHIAASHGFNDIAAKLIDNKADLEAKNVERMTPLHSAARMGREKMMHLLIAAKADIEAKDKDGLTPLIVAAGWGQYEAVEILLDAGANVFASDKRDKTAIFHAVEESQPKVLQLLLDKRGRSHLSSEIDRFQNTPLHLASKLGYLACTKVLLEFGFASDAQNEDDMCPLHLAALHGRIMTAKELIKWDPAIVNDEDEIANTPLHYAAQEGHVKTVIFLTDESSDVDAKNQFGWTPMDCAAACGMTKTLAALLDAGAEVDPIDRVKTTPLHLAAKNGHVETVLFLLENGANIRLTDSEGYNALELAIFHTKKDVAEAIIQHSKWYAAMENRQANGDTPMKKLIRSMPDIAMDVFNRCTDDSFNPESMTADCKDYAVEFDYRFLDEWEDEWDNEDGKSIISSVGEESAVTTKIEKVKYMHPLQVMVKAKRIELLDHPLVKSLLHNKWSSYGKYFYYTNLINYLIFLAALTTFAVEQIPPYVAANNGTRLTSKISDTCSADDVGCIKVKPPACFVAGYIVLISSVIRMLVEFVQLVFQRLNYMSMQNLCEIALFGCSIFFAIDVFYPKQIISPLQWQIGVFCVFAAWMNLMMFLRKFPRVGIYIVMFVTILATFLEIMVILFIFIIAFALSFHMVMTQHPAFQTNMYSIIKTFVMMTGELEYDAYYTAPSLEEPNPLFYPITSYIIFAMFIIVVPIVFMNLLVGLAVDDIKEVQYRAALERSVMKIELVYQVEMLLSSSLVQKFNFKKKRFFPNAGTPICWFFTYNDLPFNGQSIQDALHPERTGIEELKEENESIEKNLRKMRLQIDNITSQNQHLLTLVKQLVLNSDDSEISVDMDVATETASAPHNNRKRLANTNTMTAVADATRVFEAWKHKNY